MKWRIFLKSDKVIKIRKKILVNRLRWLRHEFIIPINLGESITVSMSDAYLDVYWL